ncbi:hypothetical protein IMG5_065390 [Ichthyophthirius multifiliis]|uniref:Calpain catalytic domain-containing protein n=1 Tax=Ichthyophthirius multifiliis TaxID=5932 RepID=G0QP91_ICHMU|nr:hypothetical protein IMG5_065390 [Ichthyophthirius multifiliis]EGR32971.1 hypothetical protein IMG5_065390 [Ichthyophthirius multifiliis]|eukprot:XP_004036957.1 hypothetical protein IMG5_065390 [Ichthyophthirius multifiliis]
MGQVFTKQNDQANIQQKNTQIKIPIINSLQKRINNDNQFKISQSHLDLHNNEIFSFTTKTDLITDIILPRPSIDLQNYENKLIEQNTNFQDSQFPPQIQSLTKDLKSFQSAQKYQWKRIHEFLQNPKIVSKGIQPNNIKQGELGNCYFLSSLFCIAKKPFLIERLIQTKQINKQGLYVVWICKDGEWQQVLLDDFFPCIEKDNVFYPAFSQSNENEIWVLLLEKAYAKVYGSYEQIERGLSGHFTHDLTGAPYFYLIRDSQGGFDMEELWRLLYNGLIENNYIITASFENNNNEIAQKKEALFGITSAHCYSLLDVKEIIDSEGKNNKIIQVRNPWGVFKWKEDQSDNSKKLTSDFKKQLDVQENDGTFWINLNDFVQQFRQVCVSKVNEKYKYSSIKCCHIQEKLNVKLFSMKVNSQCQGNVGISQNDQRNFSENKNYQYSMVRLMVFRIENNQIKQYIGGEFDCERDISFEALFQEGIYLVYVEFDWIQNDVREFVLWNYGEQLVEFIEINNNISQESLIEDIFQVHALSEDVKRVHKYNQQIKRITGQVCGYVYFIYQNNSYDIYLKEQLQMKNITFLNICPPHTYQDQIKINIKPGDQQIVKFKVDAKGRGVYKYQSSLSYILLQDLRDVTEQKLIQMSHFQPSKVKQREMHGKFMKVFVHTFVYYGGMCFLYINKTSSKVYVEDLQIGLVNLRCEKYDIDDIIHIEVQPQQQFLINFKTIDIDKDIAYKPKMTYFLR